MIASEMASRHQPMNWRDSIWVSDIGLAVGVPDAVNAALSSPMKENVSFEQCSAVLVDCHFSDKCRHGNVYAA